MSSKVREALEKCDALLKRITESAWFIEASIGTTKDVMDVGNAITEALSVPLRNCDVGTVREQDARFDDFCRFDICGCDKCPLKKTAEDCVLVWAQMPYEEVK